MNNRLFIIIYTILFCMIIFNNEAIAQEKKIAYVLENSVAPFTGVLLTPEAFAELKIKADLNEEQTQIRINYEVNKVLLEKQLKIDTLQIELTSLEESLQARLKLKNDQIDFLYKEIEKSSKKSLIEKLDGPLHFIGGVLITAGVVYFALETVEYSFEK